MNSKKRLLMGLTAIGICALLNAQVTDRPRPAEWNHLVPGARFMDRFLPMPDGTPARQHVWGTDSVQNRYVDNGIELPDISFWGGQYTDLQRYENK